MQPAGQPSRPFGAIRAVAAAAALCQRSLPNEARTGTTMMRWRFSTGVLLGLVAGVAAGLVIGLLVAPSSGGGGAQATALQVQELSRKLAAAQEERERADKQLERFAQLAEQMSVAFNRLDERFKALEQQALALDAATPTAAPAPVAETPPAAAP